MENHKQEAFQLFLVLARCVGSFLLGLVIIEIVAEIPSGGRLPVVPVNALVLCVVSTSILMLWKLSPSLRNSRSTFLMITAIVLIYSCLIYLLAVETLEGVTFNSAIMMLLTLSVYTVALLPFLMKQSIVSFLTESAKRDSAFFAASIMWLAPFLAEMLILLRWLLSGEIGRLNYMVLGGAGLNDVLVYYGFWAIISVSLFHLIGKYSKQKKDSMAYCDESNHPTLNDGEAHLKILQSKIPSGRKMYVTM